MTTSEHLQQLGVMLKLRQRDVDRLQAEVADKQQLQARYRRNIERMGQLCAASGASAGQQHLALALNVAGYKDHLLQLMTLQQQDLALAEADAQVSQRALLAANLRREVIVQARSDSAGQLAREQQRREQKQTDELAGQSWLRQQYAARV